MQAQQFPLQLSWESDAVPCSGVSQARVKTPFPPSAVQSFAAFRAQTSSIPGISPIRKTPLPLEASPAGTRSSSAEDLRDIRDGEDKPWIRQRSFSMDSPPLHGFNRPAELLSPLSSTAGADLKLRDLDRYPHGQTPLTSYVRPHSIESRLAPLAKHGQSSVFNLDAWSTSVPAIRPHYDRAISSYHTAHASVSDSGEEQDQATQRTHSRSPTITSINLTRRPNVTLQLDGTAEGIEGDMYALRNAPTEAKQLRAPGQKLTSFFGWKSSNSLGTESPTTTFSDRSLSPVPSSWCSKPTPGSGPQSVRPAPAALDIPKANVAAQSPHFTVPGTPLLPHPPGINAHVEQLEQELRDVSTELAHSIRREMDLEDEVERLKSEVAVTASDINRRTSDYFSDSGASSFRLPIGESDTRVEELEKLRRKVEQEKASLKVQMARKLQDELRRRRDLEKQVQQLEKRLEMGVRESSEYIAESNGAEDTTTTLRDTRRQLNDERQLEENFDVLLAALQQDLEHYRNERDNLRDEVVPQMRARVEGLEAEASEIQTLTYDNTRMQQEIESLRNENRTLSNAGRMQMEMRQQHSHFMSIAEEDDPGIRPSSPETDLAGSASLQKSSAIDSRKGSLSRSTSVRDKYPAESRDGVSESIKDIEDQRDALHRALKGLLDRQRHREREHARQIRVLERERDKALATPRRSVFYKEVVHLREEIGQLRRRADDALEQKWRCEKGLGGLKMDLDRAEQETTGLRELLQERDIFTTERETTGDTLTKVDIASTEASPLDKAYRELQTTHALSLARLKEMENEDVLGPASAEAERTVELLKQSISDAEAERDMAQREAEQYRQQARALHKSELDHLSKEQSLAAQLYASATRMDELASQVQQRITSNSGLRSRLARAIERGELQQKTSAARIAEMQDELKALEDSLMSAQQHSEEVIASHEGEIRQLQDSHNVQLQRARAGLLSPAKLGPSTPLSPLFARKSPRLSRMSAGLTLSMVQASQTSSLEKRVEDLERALSDADREMREVVSRMNMAQIEVAELQAERYISLSLSPLTAGVLTLPQRRSNEANQEVAGWYPF